MIREKLSYASHIISNRQIFTKCILSVTVLLQKTTSSVREICLIILRDIYAIWLSQCSFLMKQDSSLSALNIIVSNLFSNTQHLFSSPFFKILEFELKRALVGTSASS